MATIGTISLAKGDILTTAHVYSQNRANDGYGIISGCDVHQKTVPGMGVTIDAGVVMYDGTYTTVAGGDVVIDAADATNPRFDIIYVNAVGTCLVAKGTAAAILPTGETAFKKMTTPYPTASIPAGIILARVYVAAAVTTILNAAIDDIAMVITQVPLNILTTRGDIPFRNANTWARLAKSATSGHSLLQGADEPYWGYPDHGTTTGLTDDDHTIYVLANGTRALTADWDVGSYYIRGTRFISDIAIGTAPLSVTSTTLCNNLNADLLDGYEATAFPLISLLTEQGDMVQRGAVTWEATAHGTVNQYWKCGGHGANNAWATKTWGVDFEFGDGSAVLVAQAKTSRCGVMACKITKASIRSIDTAGALKTGSITATIYVHDYNAAIGSSVDSFALASASSYSETGLSHAVAADKYVTVVLSGISTVTQIVLSLEFEAT